MLGTGNEGDGVGSEAGIVAGGDTECSDEDFESDEVCRRIRRKEQCRRGQCRSINIICCIV